MQTISARALLAMAVVGAFVPMFTRGEPQVAPAAATAPAAEYANPNPARYLFEDKLKPGMKGYGLTVVRGGKIERFDVEILDVMKNFNPGKNEILVKCSGLGLEESGIIAGMSGSPCYIDGKLIGAVAFGWSGAKEPIGGVQPIRQMLAVSAEAKAQADAGGARWTGDSALTQMALSRAGWGTLARTMAGATRGGGMALRTAQDHGTQREDHGTLNTLTPLATPLMVSGASPGTLALTRALFAHTGMVPLQSGGAGAAGGSPRLGGLADTPDEKLKLAPGSAIGIPLIGGDMDLSAIGTVTDVDGNKVWAFGHSMFADGPTRLPISTSYIYSILPSMGVSFKIGSSLTPVGTLASDENTGIVGFTGAPPKTIPVTLTVVNADGTNKDVYHYELANHPQILAELLGVAMGSITAQRNLPRQYTLEVKGTAQFAGMALPVRSLSTSESLDTSDVILPIAVLTDNPFHNMPLEKMELVATIDPHNKAAEIRRIHLDRLSAAPGETLAVEVEYAAFQKPAQSRTLLVKLPDNAAEGECDLVIGSADAMRENDLATSPHIVMPENIAGLVGSVKRITSYESDHLFARLVLDVEGVAVHGREQRDLPASRLAVLGSDRVTGVTPITQTVTAEAAADAIFAGARETVHIRIAKDAQRRYHDEPLDLSPASGVKPKQNVLTPRKGGGLPVE